MEESTYEHGAASLDDVRRSVDEFFAEARKSPELREELTAHGADVEKALDEGPASITVSGLEEGIDPGTLILIGVGIHVGSSAWDDVVLPWIKRRLGQDAVGRRKNRRSK